MLPNSKLVEMMGPARKEAGLRDFTIFRDRKKEKARQEELIRRGDEEWKRKDQETTAMLQALRSEKSASLCERIAGTLNESDFARFNSVFSKADARELVEKSATVIACLHRLTAEPVVPAEKLASAALSALDAPGFDVVQIVPHGYGYLLKVSAAPNGVNKKEVKVDAQQAQQALPAEALQTADEQGAATLTNVEAEPDPMLEPPPSPIDGFGLYKVYEAGTGRQIVGYVIPGLFDPLQGGPSGMSIFLNGGQYALQPTISGNLVGMNFNLPHSETIRGLGLFYKTNGKNLIATVPYNVISEVSVEGRTYYSAMDPNTGMELQITISDGLKRPVATSPQEVVIPADFHFLALDNPIELEGAPDADTMVQAKQAAMPTMLEVRAWDGGCDLRGPVFEKVGGGEHDWADGLFWMAAAGIPHNLGLEILNKCASDGDALRLYGCRPLVPAEEKVTEAREEAKIALAEAHIPKRHCLLLEAAVLSMDKSAASMVGIDSIDAVLALNFVNPENVSSFVEALPQLEEASSKIASLVLATQLGLQSVPKTAAVRAMFALEDVITGLKSLKNYSI